MLCKIDKFLNSLYRYSGYIASFFLILILVFIVIGIASRIFGFYIRGLTEYSGYSLATASFLALAYTFNENGHIRITLFLEKAKGGLLRFLTIWSLAVSTFFSGFLAFILSKCGLCLFNSQKEVKAQMKFYFGYLKPELL